MAQHLVGLFDTRREAEATIRDLESMGINSADVRILGGNVGRDDDMEDRIRTATEEADQESIEGVDAETTGGAESDLLRSLLSAGIPDSDAAVYAEGIRRGGTLILVGVDEDQVDAALDVMDRNNVVDIDLRREELRGGGSMRYDERDSSYNAAGAGGALTEGQTGGASTRGTSGGGQPDASGGLSGVTAGYEGMMRGSMAAPSSLPPVSPSLDEVIDRPSESGERGTGNL